MYIKKLIVKNFKALKEAKIEFNSHLNIIVGDNEAGKSTLLEAINLVISGQINGRNIQFDLSPYLFNDEIVKEYVASLRNGRCLPPPSILIEAYLPDEINLARFKGTNNSLRENCPGLKLLIEFDEDFKDEYLQFKSSPEEIRTVPIEYYVARWFSFADNFITSRGVPLNITFIDTSMLKVVSGAERYMSKIINDVLERKQRVDLALIYRKMKDVFLGQAGVKSINNYLDTKKGDITDKKLSVSLDVSSRSTWESSLTPHLDDIPLTFAGQGEQSCVNMKLAMETSDDAHIFLVEEPENHLSFPNMNKLIYKISEKSVDRQIMVATHSSFVLNKLGVGNVILFNRGKSIKLDTLSPETKDYFMKLPGHDTLRLILSQKAILVEGASDELIVQKAYQKKFSKNPLDNGIDIISVHSLAFKRFLEIAKLLDLNVNVVTDNDGNIVKLKEKYNEYLSLCKIKINFSLDERFPTLEPQLLKENSLELLNRVFETTCKNEGGLLEYMKNNKTDCALKIFNSPIEIKFPEYIENAFN
jgi:putative ATP-dependent endonuclease of the OLD family